MHVISRRFLLRLCLLLALAAVAGAAGPVTHVIHISVDALRPDAISALTAAEVPNLQRLRQEGAWTDNARTDCASTETVPNHVTQLTSRGVTDQDGKVGATRRGHDWADNGDPGTGTLGANKGRYVAGVFDVVHKASLTTGFYASKSKLVLLANSWPRLIDRSRVTDFDSRALLNAMKADMATRPKTYVFVHFADLDALGHGSGWMSTEYMKGVRTVDGYVGEILALIAASPELKGKTAIILTADHAGGEATGRAGSHANHLEAHNFTVPFYVWGPGVQAGADLYALNRGRRADPGTAHVSYAAAVQPIRNGETGNLALQLLGLPPIPGSWLNDKQDLSLTAPVHSP